MLKNRRPCTVPYSTTEFTYVPQSFSAIKMGPHVVCRAFGGKSWAQFRRKMPLCCPFRTIENWIKYEEGASGDVFVLVRAPGSGCRQSRQVSSLNYGRHFTNRVKFAAIFSTSWERDVNVVYWTKKSTYLHAGTKKTPLRPCASKKWRFVFFLLLKKSISPFFCLSKR